MENIGLVDYSRQQEFDNEIAPNLPKDESNIIIGCGGVGFWLGLFLAMNGYKDFVLIEGEKLDATNLNRIPVPQSWIGVNKAIALRKMIRQLRPDTRVVVLASHITEDTLDVIEKFATQERLYRTTVWDTTDNALIQQKINGFVTTLKDKLIGGGYTNQTVKYRKIGYEAWDIGCYENYEVWCDEENYEAGYRTSRANAITSAMSAGLGIFARGLNMSHDISFNLKALMQTGGVSMDEEIIELKQLLRECKDAMADIANDAQGEDYEYSEDLDFTSIDSCINKIDERGL